MIQIMKNELIDRIKLFVLCITNLFLFLSKSKNENIDDVEKLISNNVLKSIQQKEKLIVYPFDL